MRVQSGKKTSLKETGKIWLTGYAAYHATPVEFLGGGPIRIFLARKKLNVTYGDAIASIIVDKVVDATFFASFLVGGVFTFFMLGNELSLIYIISGILILSLVVLLLAYFYMRVLDNRSVFLWVFKRFAGKKYENSKSEKLIEEVEKKIKIFFSNKKEVVKTFFYSLTRELLRWGRVLLIIFILIGACEIEKGLAVYGLANLSMILPVPAGIGTLEAISGYAFHSFNWGFDMGTTLALVWHGVVFVVVLLGAFLGVRFAVELVPERVEDALDKIIGKRNRE